MVFAGMLDLIIVSRVNIEVGIPDQIVVLVSDSTLSPMMQRLVYIPMFVMAARVCPLGAEATVFAMFMSLANFGSSIAIYSGSFLVFVLGITDENFDNLIYLVIIRSFARLIPIPVIMWLVPDGTPQENDDSRTSSTSNLVTSFSVDKRGSDATIARISSLFRSSNGNRASSSDNGHADNFMNSNVELRRSSYHKDKNKLGLSEEHVMNPLNPAEYTNNELHGVVSQEDAGTDERVDEKVDERVGIFVHVTNQKLK